jgi:hypothetical protein
MQSINPAELAEDLNRGCGNSLLPWRGRRVGWGEELGTHKERIYLSLTWTIIKNILLWKKRERLRGGPSAS